MLVLDYVKGQGLLQWVAQMCGVSNEYNLPDSEAWCTALLKLIRAHADQFVFIRFGMSWKNLFIAKGLALDKLLA